MSQILVDRSVVEQALEALQMMGVPSPLVFLPDEIKCWQSAQAALRAALKQPQPPRQPLTDEQINTLFQWGCGQSFRDFARAIEAAHGIKEQK